MPGELAHALERAAIAIEAGDATTATAALEKAQRACTAAEAQGVRIGGAELTMLRELHQRGEAAARRALEKLAHALGSAGNARRAAHAYRR